MERRHVRSRKIASVGWERNILEIQYHNGTIFQYEEVSADEYNCFIKSDSLSEALTTISSSHRFRPI